jgi:hypothetical protein
MTNASFLLPPGAYIPAAGLSLPPYFVGVWEGTGRNWFPGGFDSNEPYGIRITLDNMSEWEPYKYAGTVEYLYPGPESVKISAL